MYIFLGTNSARTYQSSFFKSVHTVSYRTLLLTTSSVHAKYRNKVTLGPNLVHIRIGPRPNFGDSFVHFNKYISRDTPPSLSGRVHIVRIQDFRCIYGQNQSLLMYKYVKSCIFFASSRTSAVIHSLWCDPFPEGDLDQLRRLTRLRQLLARRKSPASRSSVSNIRWSVNCRWYSRPSVNSRSSRIHSSRHSRNVARVSNPICVSTSPSSELTRRAPRRCHLRVDLWVQKGADLWRLTSRKKVGGQLASGLYWFFTYSADYPEK